IGEKPLYYSLLPGGVIAFASEIGAVLAALTAAPQLDPEALEDYFALGYVPDPKSVFRNVRKLPPAHAWILRRGYAPGSPRAYWDVSFGAASKAGSLPRGAVDELVSRLETSVRIRLESDVPLGAFLSGGVDSS